MGSQWPDTMQGHSHDLFYVALVSPPSGGATLNLSSGVNPLSNSAIISPPTTDGANGAPRTGPETAGLHVLLTPAIYLGTPR